MGAQGLSDSYLNEWLYFCLLLLFKKKKKLY